MTEPHRVVAGETLVVAYNTHSDRYLLHPGTTREECAEFRQLMAYASGFAQEKTEMMLHADGWVPNHGHSCMTDVGGRRPDFDELRNKVIADGQIVRLGLAGGVFSPNGPRPTVLLDSETIVRQMAYCLMQPVRHGLVATEGDQELFYCSRIADIGRVRTILRPECLENDDGESAYPLEVRLAYSVPPGWEGRERELRRELARLCRQYEHRAQLHRRLFGLSEPTPARALSVDPEDRPNRPRRKAEDWDFLPMVAGGSKKDRDEFIDSVFVFRQRYRRSWGRYKHGDHQSPFPSGTFRMRRRFNVRVESGEN